MGLDLVEIVLRCEETFAIVLPDDQMERVQTVGDLYGYVCQALKVTPLENPALAAIPTQILAPRSYPVGKVWTPEDVWKTLVFVVTDQLQIDAADVTYHASFQNDLGCD
jgi:acyl carrier protein